MFVCKFVLRSKSPVIKGFSKTLYNSSNWPWFFAIPNKASFKIAVNNGFENLVVTFMVVNNGYNGFYVIQNLNNKERLLLAGLKKPCSPVFISLLIPWCERSLCSYT